VTTGSTVDRIDAAGAPTRAMPSRNVTIGTTVQNNAIAAIQIQPPAGKVSAPPIRPTVRNVVAPPVATSALRTNASSRVTTPSETRM
jgi:hypothetical protein